MRLYTLLVLLVLPSALVVVYLQSVYAHRSDYANRSATAKGYSDFLRSEERLNAKAARVQDQLQIAAAQVQLQMLAAQDEQQPTGAQVSSTDSETAMRVPAHEEPLAATEPVAAAPATAMPAMRYGWHGVQHSGDESADCAPQPAPFAHATHRQLDLLVAPDETFPANCDAETKEMCDGHCDGHVLEAAAPRDTAFSPARHGFQPHLTRPSAPRVPSPRPCVCVPRCDVLRRVAINREVMVAVCDSNVKPQLELFLKGTAAAGVRNVLIIALDEPLARFLESQGVAYWLRQDAPHAQSEPVGSAPSSPPAPPRGALGGSVFWLGTPRVRPSHWAPRHRLSCSSEPPYSPKGVRRFSCL